MNYFRNVWLWLTGWGRFDELTYKPGWSAKSPKWWLLYLLDHGACVILLAGAVETVSAYAHRHRSGSAWDFLLDVIERFDPGHGATAGPALWGSVESSRTMRIVVPLLWLGGALWLFA